MKYLLYLFGLISTPLIGGQPTLDSLHKRILVAVSDTDIAGRVNDLGAECLQLGMFDSARACFERALIYARRGGDSAMAASILSNLGNSWIYMGDYIKARDYNLYALERTPKENKMQRINIYQNLGVVYENTGLYAKALEAYLEALRISEETGFQKGIGLGYMNVGLIYESLQNYPMAVLHSRKALVVMEKNNLKGGLNYCYINLGNQYKKMGKYDSAKVFIRAAIKGSEELQDMSVLANAHNSMGEVCKYTGDYPCAIFEYTESLRMSRDQKNELNETVALHNIGETYGLMKEYARAEQYLFQSLAITRRINFPDLEQETYKILAQTFMSKGDYKKAYEYQVLHTNLNDSLINATTSAQITEMQAKYESLQKDQELLKKDSELTKRDAENRQRTTERNAFIAGFALMIALAYFIFRGYRQKQKANAEITAQKHVIEEKQKDILDSIYYARRIQRSLLPTERYILQKLEQVTR